MALTNQPGLGASAPAMAATVDPLEMDDYAGRRAGGPIVAGGTGNAGNTRLQLNGTPSFMQGMADRTKQFYAARAAAKPQAPVAPGVASEDDPISQSMKQFYDHLNSPLDMNDPYVAQILQGVQNRAGDAARLRGIGGPMSIANSQQAMTNAAVSMDQEKKAMALQALGARNDRNLGLGSQALQAYGIGSSNYNQAQNLAWARQSHDLDAQNAAALNDYRNGQGMGSSIGSMIGGGLGLAASFIPGLQPLAPALVSGGSGLGGYIGGGLGGGWNPAPRPVLAGGY
jgi:hypothetical protein